MPDAHDVVTLQDVADQVGVHKSTVHRALRGDPRVDPATAARVRAAAAELGYDPEVNQAARRLSLRKSGRREPTRLVALLFPVVFTRASYFQRMFTGFVEAMGAARYDVLTRVDGQDDRVLPPIIARGEVDAVVALGDRERLDAIRAAMDGLPGPLRRPVISLLDPGVAGWSVAADLRQGGRLQVQHLLDLGHRRLLTVAGLAYGGAERLAGCREALREAGLDPDRHLTALPPDPADPPEHRLAALLDRLRAADPAATAVLAPNDQVAQRLHRLLAERGQAVPAQVSLVGFDDTDPVPGPDGDNRLTSVALPLEELGRAAARMAMDPGPTPRRELLPVVLRVRGTTAAASA